MISQCQEYQTSEVIRRPGDHFSEEMMFVAESWVKWRNEM